MHDKGVYKFTDFLCGTYGIASLKNSLLIFCRYVQWEIPEKPVKYSSPAAFQLFTESETASSTHTFRAAIRSLKLSDPMQRQITSLLPGSGTSLRRASLFSLVRLSGLFTIEATQPMNEATDTVDLLKLTEGTAYVEKTGPVRTQYVFVWPVNK